MIQFRGISKLKLSLRKSILNKSGDRIGLEIKVWNIKRTTKWTSIRSRNYLNDVENFKKAVGRDRRTEFFDYIQYKVSSTLFNTDLEFKLLELYCVPK